MGTRALSRFATLVALALALGGCAHFDFSDAADRIAFARGCDPLEVTLLEDRRGRYEESGCGAPQLFECAGGRCSAAGAARAEPSTRVTRARAALDALREAALECTDGDGVDVQVRFDRAGSPETVVVRAARREHADCVRPLVERVTIGPGPRLLVSWTAAPSRE